MKRRLSRLQLVIGAGLCVLAFVVGIGAAAIFHWWRVLVLFFMDRIAPPSVD